MDERIFYIKRCAEERYSREALAKAIGRDDYHHQGQMPNNFVQTLPSGQQALRAISTFKDEYLLDYINVEELDVRDRADVDERVVENAIVHNVKNFILTFGRDFTKPMGVATYKTSKDMSEELIEALPDIDDLKKLLDTEESEEE